MRRALLRASALAALSTLAFGQNPANDVILRAMKDELDRSRALRIAGLDDPPYYIEYSLEDADNFSVSASMGALIGSAHNRGRVPQVLVHAGSYAFDNTNHVFSTHYSGARYDTEQWPLDDNYSALRHNLWLATDRSYKTALEAIARKRSSLKNAASPDNQPDFYKAEPASAVLPIERRTIDEAGWTKRITSLSAVFAGFPEVHMSSVDFNLYQGTAYFVNSEGSIQRTPDLLVQLRAQALAHAPDGMVVHDATMFQSLNVDGLPPEQELRRQIALTGENVRALLKAPVGEAYSGPVLFEAQAAAQLLAQVLGDNLRVPRRPVADPGRPLQFAPSELEGRIGSRILPESISVVDDPLQTEWRGHRLLGFYRFDMEGVKPQPVELIDKGVLKNVLLTRQPVKGFTASNGRARLSGPFGARAAALSNLFVKTSEPKPLPELKKQLIDMIRQRNKPYGMLVRKLDYPSTAPIRELQSIAAGMQSSGSRPVSPPVLIYRVYPDGREELVRGLRFRGLNARSLRDIVAASDENFVFDFVNNGAPFAFVGMSGFLAPSSVISPSLLFEEVEFERPQDELAKPPIVPPPPIETVLR
jgi:TldD protein